MPLSSRKGKGKGNALFVDCWGWIWGPWMTLVMNLVATVSIACSYLCTYRVTLLF